MSVRLPTPRPAARPARPPASTAQRQAVRHVWHHLTQVADYAEFGPVMIVSGSGVFLRDEAGREYIDGTAGMGVSMIGHGRADVAEAMAEQARRIEYAPLVHGFSHLPAMQLATRLAGLAPKGLEVTFFTSSGSEAVEAAVKMARQYQLQAGQPRRTKVIARRGSYHGVTMGAVSATGLVGYRRPFEPLVPGFVHVAQPYVYRAETEVGCAPEEVGRRAAEALERQILFESPDTVAAFIAEPLAMTQAVKVPPPDYWPRVQEICRRYGILLIVDEVFCGFGRTGMLFGSEHWDITPDIMTMSKGITSGYAPLAGAIATRKVFEAFWGDPSVSFHHGGTYSGHPVGCAAAMANLDILEREGLVARSAAMGTQLLEGLRALADHPSVGNVSGAGLLVSVELVADKMTKVPAPPEVGRYIRDRMLDLGVIGRYAADRGIAESIYFYPPLTITAEQIARMVAVFGQALDEAPRPS